MRRDKYLCCCCCKSGPLSCAVRLDRTGYVPGEDINLDAEIQNLSRKDITASYVTMQQVRISSMCTQNKMKNNLFDKYLQEMVCDPLVCIFIYSNGHS